MNNTYCIPVGSKGDFEKCLARANKKAAKLGCPELTASFEGPVSVPVTHKGRETGHFYSAFRVTITGETPRLNGWKLTAVISPLKGDDGTLVPVILTVPGEKVSDARLSSDPLKCDHCKARRDRLETFVVAHEDGTELQVGRTCLADFLGGNGSVSPDAIAKLCGLRTNLDNELSGFTKSNRSFYSEDLVTIMAVTVAEIRIHGWVSAGQAKVSGGIATKVPVATTLRFMEALAARAEDSEETDGDILRHFNGISLANLPTEADYAEARNHLEFLRIWLDTQEEQGKLNDYLYACRVLTSVNTSNTKTFGIACSLVSLSRREQAKADGTAPVAKVSNFVGQPGERITVQGVTHMTSNTTATGLVVSTFQDQAGNVFTWFSGTGPGLTAGKSYTMKATVRAHNEYKGKKNTIINRAVFA